MNKMLTLSFFVLLITSCTVRNFQKTVDTNNNYIIFGNGGGFTGVFNARALDSQGRMYKHESNKWIYFGKIPANIVTQSFRNITQLGLHEKEVNDPGNRYYVLECNLDGKYNKWTWGAGSESENSLQLIYDMLNAAVKE